MQLRNVFDDVVSYHGLSPEHLQYRSLTVSLLYHVKIDLSSTFWKFFQKFLTLKNCDIPSTVRFAVRLTMILLYSYFKKCQYFSERNIAQIWNDGISAQNGDDDDVRAWFKHIKCYLLCILHKRCSLYI